MVDTGPIDVAVGEIYVAGAVIGQVYVAHVVIAEVNS